MNIKQVMKVLLRKCIDSPLVKNFFTLRIKFLLERMLGKNRFLFHGYHVKNLKHSKLPEKEKKTILFPTSFYLDRGLAWQSTIAKALEVRGHQAIFMPLDIHFPRRNPLYYDMIDTQFTTHHQNLYTSSLLKSFAFTKKPYSQFGDTKKFKQHRNQLQKMTLKECKNFSYNNLPLGKIAMNPVMHYFRIGKDSWNQEVVEAYKDYIAMGMVLQEIITDALKNIKPQIIFLLNGSFLDSHLFLLLAKKHNIRVISFEAGFMLNSLILGINEAIIEFPMAKYLPKEYKNYSLHPSQEKKLQEYLKERSLGKNCIFDYWGNPIFDHKKIRSEIGIDENIKPDILFTNLVWDSSMLDCDTIFSSQIDWIMETIQFYKQKPSRTLMIRIHPAEIHPPQLESQEKVSEILDRKLINIPKNVIIIPPEKPISSYPLTEISNLSLVYSSTAGLESAIMGKTVLVCGKTHYSKQGFTHDVKNRKEYFNLLSEPTPPTHPDKIKELAKKYAYFFFFGFMIPFDLVTERGATEKVEQVNFNFDSEADLLPGKKEGLDFIIDIILDRSSYTERLKKYILP